MKSLIVPLIALLLIVSCGGKQKNDAKNSNTDTLQTVVGAIRNCSRLYTTDVEVHKIVTHVDNARIKGRFLGQDIDVKLPLGERKVAIPVSADLKAYINFSNFDASNVRRSGDKIEIILPDPKVELTATKIDHRRAKEFVPLLRSNFTDAELQNYERQGRDSIIASIPGMNIIETARVNATRILVPMLVAMGFKEENIKITFRDGISMDDILNKLTITSDKR